MRQHERSAEAWAVRPCRHRGGQAGARHHARRRRLAVLGASTRVARAAGVHHRRIWLHLAAGPVLGDAGRMRGVPVLDGKEGGGMRLLGIAFVVLLFMALGFWLTAELVAMR